MVAHSVKYNIANPNSLNLPLNDTVCYSNIPEVVTISPSLSWPPGMYYHLIQSDPAFLVTANCLLNVINPSAMRVDNWVPTLGWTNNGQSSQYKHNYKALFVFTFQSGYHFYPGHPGELQFCNFLVKAHPGESTFYVLSSAIQYAPPRIGV